jgi:hypothetical protein
MFKSSSKRSTAESTAMLQIWQLPQVCKLWAYTCCRIRHRIAYFNQSPFLYM